MTCVFRKRSKRDPFFQPGPAPHQMPRSLSLRQFPSYFVQFSRSPSQFRPSWLKRTGFWPRQIQFAPGAWARKHRRTPKAWRSSKPSCDLGPPQIQPIFECISRFHGCTSLAQPPGISFCTKRTLSCESKSAFAAAS